MEYKKFIISQRRGSMTIVVLSFLQQERYGYELAKLLTNHNYVVEQSTLYPLLRRFESEGFLKSTWRSDGGREQKYYILTPEGLNLYNYLCQEWNNTNTIIKELVK